ncbi:MAG TPA: hypothetical protein VNU70_03305, partial [Puia sp.]|nr:hypothetical protein [Puia sp.]
GSAEHSYLLSQQLELTVDPVQQTGHAVLSGNDKYFVATGDYLTSISGGFQVLGKVASLDRATGALSLKYCPLGTRSGKYAVFAVYYDIIGGMFAGDLTKGSPTITNVEKSGLLAAPYVSQRLKIGNSFARPVIDAISPNTITMSIPADYSQRTATNPFLSKDHSVDRMEFQSFDIPTNPHGSPLLSKLPVLFPEGAVWVAPVSQLQQGSSDQRFVCTRSGYIDPSAIGKTLTALWKPLDEQPSGADWQTITGGSAVTVANGTGHVLFDPGSAFASFVLTLPAAPVEGSVVKIYFGGAIGSGAPVVQHLTISPNTGQQVLQSAAPGSAAAGNCFVYVYHGARKCWYREQ